MDDNHSNMRSSLIRLLPKHQPTSSPICGTTKTNPTPSNTTNTTIASIHPHYYSRRTVSMAPLNPTPRSLPQQQQLQQLQQRKEASLTTRSLYGPDGYALARSHALKDDSEVLDDDAKQHKCASLKYTVENRPYFPLLHVDSSNDESIIFAARVVLNAYHYSYSSTDHRSVDGCTEGEKTGHHDLENATVTRISGGLTNALFHVRFGTNSHSSPSSHSALVRIFGADGIINRDTETSTFARLCGSRPSHSSVVHEGLDLLGRFANGRVESWIPNQRPSDIRFDFDAALLREVAVAVARLHYGFEIPEYLLLSRDRKEEKKCEDGKEDEASSLPSRVLRPALWDMLGSWVDELSKALEDEKISNDEERVSLYLGAILASFGKEFASTESKASVIEVVSLLRQESQWLQSLVEERHPNAVVCFTHNDLCAANILLSNDSSSENAEKEKSVCIIDYEYGSVNYAMYDVANFFCELCGGNDDGIPDRGLFPSPERRIEFLNEYLSEKKRVFPSVDGEAIPGREGGQPEPTCDSVDELDSQVHLFEMASNLVWGIWGVLQAIGEVHNDTFCVEEAKLRRDGKMDLKSFDNLRYGMNRLRNYWICKEEILNTK